MFHFYFEKMLMLKKIFVFSMSVSVEKLVHLNQELKKQHC